MAEMINQFQCGDDFEPVGSGFQQQLHNLGGQGHAHSGLLNELLDVTLHGSSLAFCLCIFSSKTMNDQPKKYVEAAVFGRAVRTLVKMILTAQRDLDIALGILGEIDSPPPEATVERIRRKANQDFENAMRAIDDVNPSAALEFLRGFEGPVQ